MSQKTMSTRIVIPTAFYAACAAFLWAAPAHPQGMIIDHNCTNLSQVPASRISAAQANVKTHYAHRSHGGQITVGLSLIESNNSAYNVSMGYQELPNEPGALCIYRFMPSTDYPEYDHYFGGVQRLLDSHSTINVSMFSWCDELEYYTSGEVSDYLTRMSNLETANPNVTFIYMTANAQGENHNRHARNEQIRSYCRTNGKVLYDFADLDCWYNGAQYIEGGIPVQHPQYYCGSPDCDGYEWTHTTAASCTNKADAFWWMMARIAGWDGTPGTAPGPSTPPISLTPDKEYFSAAYDSITIFADVQPTSNFTPYIRIVTPSGGNMYITSGEGLVDWQEPYMQGPLSLGSPLSGYMAATFEFSNAAPGTYRLEGALVGNGGAIGGIDSTNLIVE